MSDAFAIVGPDDVEPERFPESGTRLRKLTEALGCTETRVNAVTLEPGQALAPHSHERREELYVSLTGGQVDDFGESVVPGE